MKNENFLFYASGIPSCTSLIMKIENEGLDKMIKKIDVRKLREIPDEIKDVPTLIIDGIIEPLVGQQAHDWVESQQYFYQKTNNFKNKIPTNTIYQDTSIYNDASSTNNDFACIKDSDDDKRTNKIYNGARENKSITTLQNIHQKIKDQKISQTTQETELNKLISMRKEQLAKYIKKK